MAGLLSSRFSSCLALSRKFHSSQLNGTTFIIVRKLSLFKRKKSDTSVVQQVKSDYEIEYDKFVKEDKWQEYYGFNEDSPYLDKATMHMICFLGFSVLLVFMPVIMCYGPDYRHNMKEWKRYEAVKLIEEREAKGEMLINPNFVPPVQLEAMVPPPGDWEEEWLRQQPAIRNDDPTPYYFQVWS